MQFGLQFQAIKPAAIIEIAQAAERAGFESLWRPDHLALPTEMSPLYPYDSSGKAPIAPDWAILDPFAVFSFLAPVTKTIKFGTSVYVLPLRNPFVTAKAMITADWLTGGRVLFGIGVGWWKEEFEMLGEDYHTRGARTDEYIRLLRTLCSQRGVTEFHGRFVEMPPAVFDPKSVQQPAPPFIIGGESEAALRRAALLGDGWKGLGYPVEKAKVFIDRIRAIRAEHGVEDRPFDVTLSVAPDVTLDTVRAYEEVGVTRLVTTTSRDRLAEFGERVIARL